LHHAPVRAATLPDRGQADEQQLSVRVPAEQTMSARLSLAACVFCVVACGEKETQRTLPSVQLAMNDAVMPSYDDGQTRIFEVRKRVPLPVLAPSEAEAQELAAQNMPPFEHMPWVTIDELRVQLSYTVTNLDERAHTVEILIDPWNEFASYYPGLAATNAEEGEYMPNLSGIDSRVLLAGRGEGERSRIHGVYTFDDMEELARDFATVMNLIANPAKLSALTSSPEGDLIMYVNHTYANHSTRDVLARGHIPAVIPALTGFDLGLRTSEPATIAIEVVAEVLDRGSEKLETDANGGGLLPAPENVITVGTAAP
jgi:hypothetical protein